MSQRGPLQRYIKTLANLACNLRDQSVLGRRTVEEAFRKCWISTRQQREFDSNAYRRALSSFPTGVMVVTTRTGNGVLAGVTVNSFPRRRVRGAYRGVLRERLLPYKGGVNICSGSTRWFRTFTCGTTWRMSTVGWKVRCAVSGRKQSQIPNLVCSLRPGRSFVQ